METDADDRNANYSSALHTDSRLTMHVRLRLLNQPSRSLLRQKRLHRNLQFIS